MHAGISGRLDATQFDPRLVPLARHVCAVSGHNGRMALHGWAEAALALPLAAAAAALGTVRVDRMYLVEVARRPRAERSRASSGIFAGFLLLAAAVALVAGVVTAL